MKLVPHVNLPKPTGDSAERILAAAEDLFAEHGFDAVSISDIATRSGVSKSNVFHHFSSKNELYLAVLKGAQEVFFKLVGDLHDGHGRLQDRLEKFATAHLQRMLELSKVSRLVLRDLLESAPERNKQVAEKIFNNNFSLLLDVIRKNQAHGEIRADINPAMAALVLVAADVFFFQARAVLQHFPGVNFAEDNSGYSAMLVDILLHGILPRSEATAATTLNSSSNTSQG